MDEYWNAMSVVCMCGWYASVRLEQHLVEINESKLYGAEHLLHSQRHTTHKITWCIQHFFVLFSSSVQHEHCSRSRVSARCVVISAHKHTHVHVRLLLESNRALLSSSRSLKNHSNEPARFFVAGEWSLLQFFFLRSSISSVWSFGWNVKLCAMMKTKKNGEAKYCSYRIDLMFVFLSFSFGVPPSPSLPLPPFWARARR